MSAICYIWAINQADVAQLDRAFGYEPKGSRFESWHPQKKAICDKQVVFFYPLIAGEKLEPTGAFTGYREGERTGSR